MAWALWNTIVCLIEDTENAGASSCSQLMDGNSFFQW